MFKIFSTYICGINTYKMQHLDVSGAVRPIYGSLGVKRLKDEKSIGTSNTSFIVWRLHVSTLYKVIIRPSLESSQ